MAFWKKPLRLGLQARISLLVTLGLALIFAFMIWEERQIADANAEMVLQARLSLAGVIAQHLDQDLDRTLSRLEQVAAFPTINLEDGDLEPEKAELRALYRPNYFSYVFLLDKDGLVLWTEPYLPDVVNREHLECPHVQETLRTGQAAIACVANALTPLSPVIAPVMPIRNRQGAIVGALGAVIDPSSPPFVSIFEGMAPGNTGYIQLVDENGIVLAHTERQQLFQKSEHADLFISLLKDTKPVIATYTMTEENKGTFREVVAFAPLTAAPWGVAVEQDEAEFLALSLETRRRMEFFAMIAMVVAFILVWVTTLSVTRPVRKLLAASERIAAGNLSMSVAVSGSEEVAELGRNFEVMRQKLAAWSGELEAAVQKRTRQLSVLYAIDRAAAQSLDLDEILNDALDRVLEVLEVEAGGIYLLEPDGETMTLRTHRGLLDEFVENVQRIKLGEGISGRAAAERKPVVLDVEDYPTERLAPVIVQAGFQTLASTPLLSAGELVGALNVATCRPRAFPPEEMELLTSIGQQLGGAVANARLHQETRERAERLSILNRIAHVMATTLNLDELLEIVHREIMAVVEADTFFIALYDREANELDFRIRIDKGVREPPEQRPMAAGLTASVVTSKQPLLIRDFEREKDQLPPAKLWGTMEVPQSWLGLPLLLGQDVIGVISVQAYRTGAFDETDQQVLSTIANAVAVAAENSRLFEAEQRRAARLDAMQRLSIELAALRDENSVLTTLVARAASLADSPACTVMLIDETSNEAVLAAQTGLPEGTPLGLRVPLTLLPIQRALETGEPILLPDIDRNAVEMRAILVRRDIRAFFAYPMIWEGRALGFLTLSSFTPHRPSAEEVTAYRLLAERVAVALVNARLHQSLRASEQEYRTLVENATELIWMHDAEGRFTFVNRQAEKVSGHKLEDWLGQSFAPLIAPPEDLPRIQQIVLETLAGKPQSYEVGVYRADGSVFHLSVNTTPLYRDGTIVGTISFGRDVSAQQEAEVALTQRMTELSALFSVSSALREARTLEEMMPIILRSTLEALHCDQGVLSLVDRQCGEVVVCVATPGQESLLGLRTKIGQGIAGRVVETGRPMLPADFADLQAPEFVRRVAGESRTVICYPLKTAAEVVGTIYLSAPLPREFGQSDLKLLTAIADMAASAIHRAGLFEQLEHRVHELSTLFDVGKMATASLHIEDVLQFVANAATEAVHAEGSYLFLWDEREERLVLRASQGFYAQDVGRMKYRQGEGLCGWVFLESQTVNIPDLAADPRWKRDPEHEAPLPSGRADNALVVPLVIGKEAIGVLGVINKISAPDPLTALRANFSTGDESLLTALAGGIAIAIENARLYEDVRNLSIAAIRSLATAIDARDPYTHGHSEGVTVLAVQLARELGWGGADLEMLEFAALLHDVGKIAVPDAILRKVEPLTPDEWDIIRRHPYHSGQIVKPVESLQKIVPWIYHHQEKWDGTGYPDGLKGKSIPLASRIIAVADAFNAMTTDRPYRKALPVAEALAEIKRGAGGQFDPQVAKGFLQMMKRA